MIVYDDDRREALVVWKSRLGSGATYRALIEVFFKAGRLDYADAVCDLLKDSSDTRGRDKANIVRVDLASSVASTV
jgi:pentatricopeptide repeat protein